MSLVKGLFHPLQHRFAEFLRHTATLGLPVIRGGEFAATPGLIITGSGPSLARYGVLQDIRHAISKGFAVMACKESVRLLTERGIKVTYAVATDPKEDQIAKTAFYPHIHYLFGSICHPTFLQHFIDLNAKISIFHVRSGARDAEHMGEEDPEAALLHSLWPGDIVVMDGGVSVFSRAMGLGVAGGAQRFIGAGCDFGWRQHSSYYAKGAREVAGNYGPIWCDNGMLDGVPWYSKHDQLVCAEHLAKAVLNLNGALTVLGDTVAKGLVRKFSRDILAGRPCWGHAFKRVPNATPPLLGAPINPTPFSEEAIAAAKALGFAYPGQDDGQEAA